MNVSCMTRQPTSVHHTGVVIHSVQPSMLQPLVRLHMTSRCVVKGSDAHLVNRHMVKLVKYTIHQPATLVEWVATACSAIIDRCTVCQHNSHCHTPKPCNAAKPCTVPLQPVHSWHSHTIFSNDNMTSVKVSKQSTTAFGLGAPPKLDSFQQQHSNKECKFRAAFTALAHQAKQYGSCLWLGCRCSSIGGSLSCWLWCCCNHCSLVATDSNLEGLQNIGHWDLWHHTNSSTTSPLVHI